MPRRNASAISTKMVECEARWDRPNQEKVTDDMSGSRSIDRPRNFRILGAYWQSIKSSVNSINVPLFC